MTPRKSVGALAGWYTGCLYEFREGERQLVDRRDLPGFGALRGKFEES
jgi:hypothetical protein